jgi:oxygen-dependent protoporphyrinogen oxidase
MPERTHVAVVGGGITGLATAFYLRQAGIAATVLEAGDRLGGKIRTDELAGVPVEAGPDTFLARVPWAVDLCRDLGLADELVAPATGKAFISIDGRLRPLPDRHVLGVPTSLGPLVRSGVLSPAGVARAALDAVLPRTRYGDDPSVAGVVGRRMGREVVDRLVGPLVGGINAGGAEHLSLRSTAPQLADAARHNRSLVLGLRRRPVPAGAAGPVFLGVAGGLTRLVDRLREVLAPGADLRLGTAVTALERGANGRWRLVTGAGDAMEVDGCVLTTPAPAAAGLLRPLAPDAAGGLDAIRYASVALATMGYWPENLRAPLVGSGYLVPRSEGRLHTACTFTTTKWPALARSGLVLVRASAGRQGDDRPAGLDDDELVARLHAEVAGTIGATEAPIVSRVDRWPDSFPQYDVGHQARVDSIDAALAAAAPGVVVAGAAYRGLGIASCIAQAREVATRVAALLPVPGGR